MKRYSTQRSKILITAFTLILGFGLGDAGKADPGPQTSQSAPVLGGRTDLALNLLSPAAAVKVGLYFEIGFAVENLEEAMAQFTSGFGVEWQQPAFDAVLNMRLANGQVVPLRFQGTSSVQGPPYFEMVHVTGPGDHPWKANAHKSPVHIGYAVDNLAADSDALVAAGFPRIATVDVPGQSAAIFAYHQGPGDILFELVDKAFLPPGVCDTPGSPFCPPAP
ncbi:MAG TPA: VOC family protein [Thermoanaerobaculia bacterium]|nr:VOC family protein [Thermoanaerobaculia bacterium]